MAPVDPEPLLGGAPTPDSPRGGPEPWKGVRPLRLRGALDPAWAARFPLVAKGRHIVDAQGDRFPLRGVNWYGASDVLHVVGGLDVQSVEVICETVRDLGFNVVRLPFSNEMLRMGVPREGAVDYQKNPRLRGLTALEVYDEVVRSLGRANVAVIVNNHTTYGEFCGPPSRNSLWFDPYGDFAEEQWIMDWVMMARRYSRCPHVVGFDLRNEIRPRKSHWPSWVGGTSELQGKCNWARAARAAAERISEVNPNGLLVVERIVWPQGGLREMAACPGPLLPALRGRLVLGVHMYHWSGPGRFVPRWSEPPRLAWLFHLLRALGVITRRNYGDLSRDQLREQVQADFGCVLDEGLCPVWVSEFGADLGNEGEMRWLQDFVQVLADVDADWAYWPLNVGPKPGCGSEESYGMLGGDWRPKAVGDYRLTLLQAAGLEPPAGALQQPAGPPPPLQAAHASEEDVRALLRGKDPLLAMKSAPDVRGALRSLAPGLAQVRTLSGMRRVQTAGATMSEVISDIVGQKKRGMRRASSEQVGFTPIEEEDPYRPISP